MLAAAGLCPEGGLTEVIAASKFKSSRGGFRNYYGEIIGVRRADCMGGGQGRGCSPANVQWPHSL